MNETQRCVDVNDEPMHKEIFINEKFRIYVAVITPGESTLYHRHSEDTLYITLEGGMIKNENSEDFKNHTIIFPKSFCKLTLMRMGLQKTFSGFVKFCDGMFFMMPNKHSPVIHKAVASIRNMRKINLMGIEIYRNRAESKRISISTGKEARKEFETDNNSIFSLLLEYNQFYVIDKSANSFCFVCMKGSAKIESEKHGNQEEKAINKNEYYVQDSPDKLVIRNLKKDSMKMLFIIN